MGERAVDKFVSLDGVMQSVLSPDEDRDGGFDQGGWVLPYVDATVEKFMTDSTAGAAALLLARQHEYTVRFGTPRICATSSGVSNRFEPPSRCPTSTR